MTEYRIYKKNVIEALQALSNYEFQKVAWFENNQGLMYSFSENISDLFDDFYLEKALYDGKVIVFDKETDQALRDLNDAVTRIMHNSLSEKELLNHPKMQVVREKAAKALASIEASDGSESTVEIVE